MLRSRRLALAAAALLFGLSACGDANPSTLAGKTPVVIHVGSNGGRNAAGATVDRSMMPYIGNVTYVFDGQFPDLGSTAGAWSLVDGRQPDLARVAAIAHALGVQGDVRGLPADQGGGWAVGPTDGTGPTLNVANDAMLSWWYNGASAPTAVGCGIAGSSGGSTSPSAGPEAVSPPDGTVPPRPVDPVVVPPCEPPPPPANVPGKDEALARAEKLFAAIGAATADYEFVTSADPYSASVNGWLLLGGHRSQLQLSVGFGAEGAVTWASGMLGSPQPVADYPLVSGDVAVQRLNDPTGKWTFFGGPRMLAGGGVAADTAVNDAGAPAGRVDDPATGTKSIVAPLPPDSIVCDPSAGCTVAPPQPVTVHLNAARLDLTMVWAQDGTVWLLPAYTFTSTDGGEYTVVAVEASFLDIPTPGTTDTVPTPNVTDPVVTAPTPDPDLTVPGTNDLPDVTIPQPLAEKTFIGLSPDEAKLAAERNGWTIRISTLDGVSQILTADYSPTRVNLSVEGGVVVGVDSIG